MRAFVYWNLHKHLFSVRDTRTGRVAHHARRVDLRDVTFAVGAKGRERVLAERRKNVHAGARGEVAAIDGGTFDPAGWEGVTYNPYRHATFVRVADEAPVSGADEVAMVIEDGKARVYARGLRLAAAEVV